MIGRSLVTAERTDHVLVISMQRGEKYNAVNRQMADELDAALNQLDDDDELWAGVLTGTRDAFCAGSDLTAGGDYVTERGGEYGIIRRERRKPLVAAVEGFALGGGLEVVLACDLVVASTSARFGLPEVKRGVVPTCGALFRGPRALPVNLAREMVLTGDPIDAGRAYAVGFVNLLVEPGDALDRAVELAGRLCSNAPLAVQACLAAMGCVLESDDELGWAATTAAYGGVGDSEDLREGVAAFLEKRRPVWSGR
jgi:enoyl-CoA hydratase/carnithine racemase